MRVLVGCEFSGAVRDAFARRGHDAWSCDILPSDAGGNHFQEDIVSVLERSGHWDVIVLHPPCTALCVSGNRWYGAGCAKSQERTAALEWTARLWRAALARGSGVALENPVGVLARAIGRPAQTIQPWQYGHGETKATCLWLAGLAPLVPTSIVSGREQRVWKMPPSADRWKLRSLTFPGIAEAMASQWGSQPMLKLCA